MNLLRIPRNDLHRAWTSGLSMGLLVDRIYGDTDARFLNIAARRASLMGNHAPRWTAAECACLASALDMPAPAHTPESRCVDEVEYFARKMSDEELAQYTRWTTKRPLLWFAVLAALPFVGEALCRLLGA